MVKLLQVFRMALMTFSRVFGLNLSLERRALAKFFGHIPWRILEAVALGNSFLVELNWFWMV